MFTKTRLAGSIVAGVLGLSVTGAAALAAFQAPVPTAPGEAFGGATATVQMERKGPGEALKAILDRLVQNGTITQAQEEAILRAVSEAADRDREGERHLKAILGDLMKLSADYLDMTKEQLGEALRPGKSLGEIANATAGKSRDGLIAYLEAQVSAQIDKLVADGKITQEQAAKAKAGLHEHVVKFVDHKFEPKQTPPKERGKHVQAQAFLGDLMKAATDYLGIERGQITSQMAQGKSLAEIASATPGKSRAELVQALVTAANANIDDAVTKGKLTADQTAKAKERVPDAVAKFVDAHRVKRTAA